MPPTQSHEHLCTFLAFFCKLLIPVFGPAFSELVGKVGKVGKVARQLGPTPSPGRTMLPHSPARQWRKYTPHMIGFHFVKLRHWGGEFCLQCTAVEHLLDSSVESLTHRLINWSFMENLAQNHEPRSPIYPSYPWHFATLWLNLVSWEHNIPSTGSPTPQSTAISIESTPHHGFIQSLIKYDYQEDSAVKIVNPFYPGKLWRWVSSATPAHEKRKRS